MNLFWSIVYSIGILLIGFAWGSAVQKAENEETVHFLQGIINSLKGENK